MADLGDVGAQEHQNTDGQQRVDFVILAYALLAACPTISGLVISSSAKAHSMP